MGRYSFADQDPKLPFWKWMDGSDLLPKMFGFISNYFLGLLTNTISREYENLMSAPTQVM
jgi:hypothetical protein